MCECSRLPVCLPAVVLLCCAVLAGSSDQVVAQDQKAGGGPPGFGPPFPRSAAELDGFFEKLFGGADATAEDQQALQAIEVSPEDERKLGAQMVAAGLADAKRRRMRVVERGRDVEYLEQLVRTLQPMMENGERYESIRVLVLDTPVLEARSFPGGTLVFSRGMLEFAGNEAAVVGIVGHELAHLDRGHQLLPIRRLKLLRQMPPGNGQRFSPEALLSTGQTLMRLSRPFRPEEEAAADGDAVAWMHRAGYDPQALADLFERLDRRLQNPRFPIPAMFRSHPVNAARQRAVLARFDELQRDEPRDDLYVGAENLRRRVARSEREFEE